MKKKKPRIATLEEVSITRDGDYAVIVNGDSTVAAMHLQLGPTVNQMTDEQILARFNEIAAMNEMAAGYEHIAIEIPPGSPQVEYSAAGDQWSPRGHVLRAVISDDEDGRPIICIDDREFSLKEFGQMLTTFAGWGMRVIFAPDDETELTARIEVREPTER